MFGFNSSQCKRELQKAFSGCFELLKDELGTVPVEFETSKYITASMLAVCEAYAGSRKINRPQKVALITDAAFESVFRRESTNVLKRVDQWLKQQDSEFMSAYQAAKSKTASGCESGRTLNIGWLQEYASKHFEPSKTLML